MQGVQGWAPKVNAASVAEKNVNDNDSANDVEYRISLWLRLEFVIVLVIYRLSTNSVRLFIYCNYKSYTETYILYGSIHKY